MALRALKIVEEEIQRLRADWPELEGQVLDILEARCRDRIEKECIEQTPPCANCENPADGRFTIVEPEGAYEEDLCEECYDRYREDGTIVEPVRVMQVVDPPATPPEDDIPF